MPKSTVYFADFRCSDAENLQQKFARLLKTAGIAKIGLDGKYVAVKTHFGEPGCLAYLRPNWAKTLADSIRDAGGLPFLTDANTLYVGRRKNALDHISAAYENGFSPFATGCHVIIADGLKGTDDVAVPVPDGKYVKEAYIGRALVDADAIVSLTHFKCHEMTGIGGALKNLGMGGGSRAGKKSMHSSVHPQVDAAACVGCGKCTRECAHGACTVKNRKAHIDPAKCVGCGRCIGACNRDAIQSDYGEPCTVMHGQDRRVHGRHRARQARAARVVHLRRVAPLRLPPDERLPARPRPRHRRVHGPSPTSASPCPRTPSRSTTPARTSATPRRSCPDVRSTAWT